MISAIGDKRINASGFTLMEISGVLFIVSLVVVLGSPMFGGAARRIKARAFAMEVHQRLQSARGRAVALEQPISVNITAPVGISFFSSTPEAIFYPDGSADSYLLRIPDGADPLFEIRLDENGRLNFDEL